MKEITTKYELDANIHYVWGMRPFCTVFVMKIIIARKVRYLPTERQILERFIYAKCYMLTSMHI